MQLKKQTDINQRILELRVRVLGYHYVLNESRVKLHLIRSTEGKWVLQYAELNSSAILLSRPVGAPTR